MAEPKEQHENRNKKRRDRRRQQIVSSELNVKVNLGVVGGEHVVVEGEGRDPTGKAPRGGDADAQEARNVLRDRKLELQVEELEDKARKRKREAVWEKLGIEDLTKQPMERGPEDRKKEDPHTVVGRHVRDAMAGATRMTGAPSQLVPAVMKLGGKIRDVVAYNLLSKKMKKKIKRAVVGAGILYAGGKFIAQVMPAVSQAVNETLGVSAGENPVSAVVRDAFAWAAAVPQAPHDALEQASAYALAGVSPPNLWERTRFQHEIRYQEERLSAALGASANWHLVRSLMAGGGSRG